MLGPLGLKKQNNKCNKPNMLLWGKESLSRKVAPSRRYSKVEDCCLEDYVLACSVSSNSAHALQQCPSVTVAAALIRVGFTFANNSEQKGS
jgi:hypothetical protein